MTSVLYVDFRDGFVRIVQGHVVDKNTLVKVDAYGTLELPDFFGSISKRSGLFQYAEIMDAFLMQNKMKTKKVVAGFGQQGVITRAARVPKMKQQELDSMIRLEWREYLPVSPEEYAFDYKIESSVVDEGREYYNLMVAGIKHEHIKAVTDLFLELKMKPLVYDVLPNSLGTLVALSDYSDLMAVEVSPHGSRIAIYQKKDLFVYADIPIQYDIVVDIDYSVLVSEIGGYVDYFSSRNLGKTLDKIFIFGEITMRNEVRERLENELNISVSMGNAGEFGIDINDGGSMFSQNSSIYGGNMGLMIRDSKISAKVKV